MKIITILSAMLIFSLSAISQDNDNSLRETTDVQTQDPIVSIPYIRVERMGGGNKIFDIYPTKEEGVLKAVVSQFNFHDTLVTIFITDTPETEPLFTAYHDIVSGKVSIIENTSKKNSGLTGTWVRYYVVNGDMKTEITNPKIKETLFEFERIITVNMEKQVTETENKDEE